MNYLEMKSPIGLLTLVGTEVALLAVLFKEQDVGSLYPEAVSTNKNKVLNETEKQLLEYFKGKREEFELPIEFRGTEFQKKVWQALQKIPYGVTWSYGELAKKIRSPSASRAVGAANGRNSIPIIVPCHRVIGANGNLTGFAGGLKAKEILLKLEGLLL
jgi:methylated-DNA-[protein]-cysteine S-methyltransferase